ncbi:ABC transporter substrate-binding protein [Cupriavidus sp. UYPR2.512]|uniref:ABC transporter substrate-binding protein n=1 Tax=Cupriavidus sp. UYPR2.512 TaxID=1080187 RepID=UPI00037F68CE|nr:ABC transporter substrate-binding protein [Cupriavidus sp. UYPR2.512]UIF84741.1 ABC transporter substrate-binding protein [Cupriavidus necator]
MQKWGNQFRVGLAVVALCLSGASPGWAAEATPVRVGLMTAKSGPVAAAGADMEASFRYFLDSHKGVLAGHPVELVVVDTGAVPAIAKTKVKQLIDFNKVDVLVGPIGSAEAIAIVDSVEKAQIPLIVSSAGAEDLTQRLASSWMTRTTGSSAQPTHALGDYARKKLGYKRVVAIGDDVSYSYEAIGGFQRVFEDGGGVVVKKIWAPLGVTDYAPYLTQIPPGVDAVFAALNGSNAIRFIKQYKEYGYKQKLPVISSVSMTDESLLRQMGDEADGIVSAAWYSPAIASSSNQKFVSGYQQAVGRSPGSLSVGGYFAAAVLEDALQHVGANFTPKTLAQALRQAKLTDTPRGSLTLDQYGNPVAPVYVLKTVKTSAGLANQVIQTYPSVSQFWTYDPVAFLKNPVYSRDFPPVKAGN